MLKNIVVIFLFNIIIGCTNKDKVNHLNQYLKYYNIDFRNCKVICIIPAEGCNSCIGPSIDYSKKAPGGYLLVLSSIYRKTINEIVDSNKLDTTKILIDSNNLGASMGLVSFVSPCYYFIRDGKIIKIVDLNSTTDKVGIIKEVESFLNK